MLGKRRTYASPTFIRQMAKKYVKKRKYKKNALVPKLYQNVLANKSQWVRTTLAYCEQISLNPGAAGTAAVNVYCSNGLYDPNITGAGHQPAGFDQYMQMFAEYYVPRAYIKVRFSNTDVNAALQCGITNTVQVGALTDARVYIENGATKTGSVGVIGSGDPLCLSQYIDVSKFVGKSTFSNADYWGDDSINPTEKTYWHVWVCDLAGGAFDPSACYCFVEIEYEVYFRRPKNVALS